MGEWGKSRSFSITGGVRQGCVLSPRLFTAVLEWALRQWRTEIGNAGFDLGDAFDNLVDLRFADDILLFANSGPEVAQIWDKFVKAVGKVGLRLNVDKTVILTNEAQPPSTLVTKDGLILKVLERNQGQKWLGCILTASGSMMQHLDLSYHMEQGTKSMHANRWILQDNTTSIYTRLKYFNACVSAVVCFGGGHRTMYKKQLHTLDVLFRKLCRSIVTPPSDTDWSLEWHEILHPWNDRARTFAQTAGLQPWSYCVCRQHWKLASHIANLPEYRLVRRILAWNPSVRYRSLGRRPHTWDYQLQAFCRYKGLGPWLEEAKYHHHWNALFEDFYTFCQMWEQFEISCETNVHISFHRLCPKWARLVAYRHWPLTIDHLPSKVQPPSFLHTHNGSKYRILQQQEAHKWLGCSYGIKEHASTPSSGCIKGFPGQVRSGQVRPARQWRARFRAQAQKAQYVHNCHLHAAKIDKWR